MSLLFKKMQHSYNSPPSDQNGSRNKEKIGFWNGTDYDRSSGEDEAEVIMSSGQAADKEWLKYN